MLLKSVVVGLILLTLNSGLLFGAAEGETKHENQPKSGYKDYYLKPLSTASEILHARGFIADEFYFKTSDGYILSIIRGRNPLFKPHGHLEHKRPILFMHGAISSAPIWLVNSRDAFPEDLTKLVNKKMSQVSLNELFKLIGHSDSTRSLPLLALNFGYEVWLLNRRGVLQSEQKDGHLDRSWAQVLSGLPRSFIGGNFSMSAGLLPQLMAKRFAPSNVTITQIVNATEPAERRTLIHDFWINTLSSVGHLKGISKMLMNIENLKMHIKHTFDADYWNYSLDEQAADDFPQAIEFVLNKTKHKKLHVAVDSAGSPIALMALTVHPSLADKIVKLIHWSGCLNTGTESDIFTLASSITPLIQSYIGPIPFSFLTPQLQTHLQTLCHNELRQRTLCTWLFDPFFGPSNGQTPITRFVLANALQPTSSREIQHLLQMSRELRPHKFNYNTEELNIEKYGQKIAPEYDFGKIRLHNMVFYTGVQDVLSSEEMIKFTVSQLKVPYKFVLYKEKDLFFNHLAPFVHDQVAHLIILPSLMDFELADEHETGHSSDHHKELQDIRKLVTLQAQSHQHLKSHEHHQHSQPQPHHDHHQVQQNPRNKCACARNDVEDDVYEE